MYNEQERYQNLLTQIHELNRQNLLNENEKIEQVSAKIDILNQSINNTPNNTNSKILIVLLIFLLINTGLLTYLVFQNYQGKNKNSNLNSIDITKVSEEKKDEIILEVKEEEKNTEDVLSFDKEAVEAFEDESYSEIKPLIRKRTPYTCKDDETIYKIPYTVEIKGKLYSDRFMFILQEDSITKECAIEKENM